MNEIRTALTEADQLIKDGSHGLALRQLHSAITRLVELCAPSLAEQEAQREALAMLATPPEPMTNCPHGVPHRYACELCAAAPQTGRRAGSTYD